MGEGGEDPNQYIIPSQQRETSIQLINLLNLFGEVIGLQLVFGEGGAHLGQVTSLFQGHTNTDIYIWGEFRILN